MVLIDVFHVYTHLQKKKRRHIRGLLATVRPWTFALCFLSKGRFHTLESNPWDEGNAVETKQGNFCCERRLFLFRKF